jgi:hypothetical protein
MASSKGGGVEHDVGRRKVWRWAAGIAALVMFAPGWALAQNPVPKQSAPSQSSQAPAIPTGIKQSILIRSTLIAVSQANTTGNYSVLRELGTPEFQQANSPAQLGDIFGNLRRRKIDLTPVVYYEPKLLRPAGLDKKGRLRLAGVIESRPEQINFDMIFSPTADGDWRLFGIAVELRQTQTAAAVELSKGERSAASPRAVSKDNRATDQADKKAAFSGWQSNTTLAKK